MLLNNNVNIIQNQVGDNYIISTTASQCNTDKESRSLHNLVTAVVLLPGEI
jgi:hypothetical protein